jgi:hypothetical protein
MGHGASLLCLQPSVAHPLHAQIAVDLEAEAPVHPAICFSPMVHDLSLLCFLPLGLIQCSDARVVQNMKNLRVSQSRVGSLAVMESILKRPTLIFALAPDFALLPAL